MNEVLRRQIAKDAAQAKREQENCDNCPGLENCRNGMRGWQAVIRHYEDGLPYLAVRRCEKKEADNAR